MLQPPRAHIMDGNQSRVSVVGEAMSLRLPTFGHLLMGRKNELFSHYRPARYLFENAAALAQEIFTETLKRFEDPSKAMNALL